VYCEAQIIQQHALDSTGGVTYAELDREDPLREVAMNASFLRASLFTSVVAFGVAGIAILIGLLFILIGLGIRERTALIDLRTRLVGRCTGRSRSSWQPWRWRWFASRMMDRRLEWRSKGIKAEQALRCGGVQTPSP